MAEKAKARVQAEVEAHFADAVADALARGKSRAAAEAEALAALSNRFDAQHLMARSNLTVMDEQYLKGFLRFYVSDRGAPFNPRLLAWGWIPLILPVFLFLIHGMVWLRIMLLVAMFFAAVPFFEEIRKRVMRGRERGQKPRLKTVFFRVKAVLLPFLLWYGICFFLLSAESPRLNIASYQTLIQLFWLDILPDLYALRIIRKLGGWQALEQLANDVRQATDWKVKQDVNALFC